MLYYALGVLSAGILALLVAPPLWRRAVRLTRRAIEQTMPMTAAEIQAEKDQIRAAFAVSTRRLDATIERLESQVTDQLIDINRKREIIAHLTAEGSLSAEDMIALEKQRDELLLKVAAQESALADAARRHTALELQVAELDAALAAAKAAHERTIAEHVSRGINPPMLLHHDPRNIGGTWTELREDGRGLFVRGQFAMRTTAGKEAYELASMGALTGISIGFRERAGKDVGSVRHLTDIDLVEISLVALPSADGARIKSVRADSGLAAFITAAREAASFIRTHCLDLSFSHFRLPDPFGRRRRPCCCYPRG